MNLLIPTSDAETQQGSINRTNSITAPFAVGDQVCTFISKYCGACCEVLQVNVVKRKLRVKFIDMNWIREMDWTQFYLNKVPQPNWDDIESVNDWYKARHRQYQDVVKGTPRESVSYMGLCNIDPREFEPEM